MVRRQMRLKRLSPRTEEAYLAWVRRYIAFHGKRHPQNLGEREILAFCVLRFAPGMKILPCFCVAPRYTTVLYRSNRKKDFHRRLFHALAASSKDWRTQVQTMPHMGFSHSIWHSSTPRKSGRCMMPGAWPQKGHGNKGVVSISG